MDYIYEEYKDLHVRSTILYIGSRSDGVAGAFFDLAKKEPCSQAELGELYQKGVVLYEFDLTSGEDYYYRPVCRNDGVLYFLKKNSSNKVVLSDIRGWDVPV